MFITFMVLIVVVIFIIVIVKIKQHQQAKIYEQQKKLQEEERQIQKQIQKQKRDEAKQRRLEAKEKDKVKYLEEINKQNAEHPEYKDMYFQYIDEFNNMFWKHILDENTCANMKKKKMIAWNNMVNGTMYDKDWKCTPYNFMSEEEATYKNMLQILQDYKSFAANESEIFKSDDIDITSYTDRLCDDVYSGVSNLLVCWTKSNKEKLNLAYKKMFLEALKRIVNELKEREELKHIYEEEGRTDKLLSFSEKIFLHRATKYINEQTY